MNTEAEFRTALKASPDDPLLLSAYADFLEERNDQRAAYLRDDVLRPWMGGDFRDPLPALTDAIFAGRRNAAAQAALARVGEPAALPLVELLTRNDAGVRSRASLALRKLGVAARPAVPRLLELLRHAEPLVRLEAVRVLRKAKPEPVTDTAALRTALTDAHRPIRAAARLVLQSMGATSAAAVELAEALAHPSPGERIRAASALAVLRTRAAVDAVATLLDDVVVAVRVAAVGSLGELFAHHADEGPLLRAMTDADEGVRCVAAGLFRRAGRPLSGDGVDGLRRSLSDACAGVRAAGAGSLAHYPEQAVAALTELARRAADSDASVRLAAVNALRRMPESMDTTGIILAALGDDDDIALEAVTGLAGRATIPANAVGPTAVLLRRVRTSPRFHAYLTAIFSVLARARPVTDVALDAFAEEMADDRPYRYFAATSLYELGSAAARLLPNVLSLVERSAVTQYRLPRVAHAIADADGVALIVEHIRERRPGWRELLAEARQGVE